MGGIRRHADGRAHVHVNPRVAQIIAGEIDPRDWDDEELLRGYPRAKDGTFKGRPPSVVPHSVYEEFLRRQFARIEQDFATNVAKAAERLTAIATDPDVDEAIQLRAIDMLLTRVLGKPKEMVQISGVQASGTTALQELIAAVTIRRDVREEDEPGAEVIDVTPADDDDEWVDVDRAEAWR